MNGALVLASVAAAAKETPLINWAGLGKVVVLAMTTAVVIVGGYSLGLAALDVYVWSRETTSGEGTRRGPLAVAAESTGVRAAEGPVRYASLVVAVFFFALCVGGVAFGLWAMISKS